MIMANWRSLNFSVPDNYKTTVVHNGEWKDKLINETYQEMVEHYDTTFILVRVITLDRPNAKWTVVNISI